MPPALRAVSEDEKPARRTYATVSEALEGSSRDVMAAMRKALAKKLDAGEVSSNAIASVSKEIRELDRLIRQFDTHTAEEVPNDDQGIGFDASVI